MLEGLEHKERMVAKIAFAMFFEPLHQAQTELEDIQNALSGRYHERYYSGLPAEVERMVKERDEYHMKWQHLIYDLAEMTKRAEAAEARLKAAGIE